MPWRTRRTQWRTRLNEGGTSPPPHPDHPALMAEGPAAISFGFIDRRVMSAVERVAGSDPDPGDPFRGLYISDEVALRLSQGESGSDADERLTGVVAALGLDLLEAAVLAVCA